MIVWDFHIMHPQSHSFPSPYTSALHRCNLFHNRKLKKNKVKKNKNIKQNSISSSLGNYLLLYQSQTSLMRVTALMYPVPLYLCQADALSFSPPSHVHPLQWHWKLWCVTQYTLLFKQLYPLQWAVDLVQGLWLLLQHQHWTFTETPFIYPVVGLCPGDPVAIVPQDWPLHML